MWNGFSEGVNSNEGELYRVVVPAKGGGGSDDGGGGVFICVFASP